MKWIERILFTISVLLIGAVIGSQWALRDNRKELSELRDKVTFLERIQVNNNGDVIIVRKGE